MDILFFEVDGKRYKVQEQPWILELADTNAFAPDFSPERSKIFFYKNNLPYLANRELVAELLTEKRATTKRSKLRGHEADLPVPIGEFKDLSDYFPIQNDLPETYFVGQNLVPDRFSNRRKAQSKQLKGYLLFFEQLLANYFSQLAHIKNLFSWEKENNNATYFTQPLQEIAEIEQQYFEDYDTEENSDFVKKLNSIIETQEVANERKNRFLDHLIGRFSESFVEYSLLMKSRLGEEIAAERLIADKQAFLAHYPKISSQRSKGFDYRTPNEPQNLTGLQRRVYHLLGIYNETCQAERQQFAHPGICIARELRMENGVNVDYYYFGILNDAEEECGCDWDEAQIVPDESIFVFRSKSCRQKEDVCIMIDTLLQFGTIEANWCALDHNPFDTDPNDTPTWVLKRTCTDCTALSGLNDFELEQEEILGYTIGMNTAPDADQASDKKWNQAMENLVDTHFVTYSQKEGFHVIEHILLRKRTLDDAFLPIDLQLSEEDCDCVEVKDPYSFRATVLLPSWSGRFQSTRFRQYVEKLIRLEAPAHIFLKICWINHCEMRAFECCHNRWLEELAQLSELNANLEQTALTIKPPPPPEILGHYKGQLPLPPLADLMNIDEQTQLTTYNQVLADLIAKINDLTNVYPVARLHDCEEINSEEPQITLNNTRLGSL